MGKKVVFCKILMLLFLNFFLAGCVALEMKSAQSINAQHGFEIIVLGTQNPDNSGGRVFRLQNGDPLESGAGFRIKLTAQKKSRIDIKFNSSQGETITLGKPWYAEKGSILFLPEKDGWYNLDQNTGTETVIIEVEDSSGSKGRENFIIQHINPAEISGGAIDIADSLKLNEKDENGYKKNPETPLKSISLRGVKKMLDQINSADEKPVTKTRGLVGPWIKRQYSTAVVNIGTDSDYGTGFILDNGDIITNWHVIGGFQSVGVTLHPDIPRRNHSKEVLIGKVVNSDKMKDLAIIKVVDFPENYPSVDLGQSSDIQEGGTGHAIGGSRWTYTTGAISGVLPDYEWASNGDHKFRQNIIQTQTPINPGSSGAPLFNDHGKVIGIMTWSEKKKTIDEFCCFCG